MKSKSCATKCTPRELAMLAYWQERGYRFKRDQKVPLNTLTPPSFAVDHPVLDALFGGLGIVVAVCLGVAYLAKAMGAL